MTSVKDIVIYKNVYCKHSESTKSIQMWFLWRGCPKTHCTEPADNETTQTGTVHTTGTHSLVNYNKLAVKLNVMPSKIFTSSSVLLYVCILASGCVGS